MINIVLFFNLHSLKLCVAGCYFVVLFHNLNEGGMLLHFMLNQSNENKICQAKTNGLLFHFFIKGWPLCLL